MAGVITDDHGRALLIQRRDNHRWAPPGGVLEPSETIYDGPRREIREETGLDVEPVALVFRCKISGGDLATTDEVSAFRCATGTEVTGVTELADEAYAVRVFEALDGDHAVGIRHHDGVHLL